MKKLLLVLFLAVFSSGCIYSDIKAPMNSNVDKTELGTKVGKASIYSALWLVAWGDGSTYAAAQDGGLVTINQLDVEQFSILFGLYTKTTTIAYGN